MARYEGPDEVEPVVTAADRRRQDIELLRTAAEDLLHEGVPGATGQAEALRRIATELEALKTSAVYAIERHGAASAGGGCVGSALYIEIDPETDQPVNPWIGHGGISPEGVIGQLLDDGARVRVHVEVIEDVRVPDDVCRSSQDFHKAHKPGPNYVDENGERWVWSAPDGVRGTRQLWHTRRVGNTEERYREQSYSAGWRHESWSDDEKPLLGKTYIERRYGLTLTEETA